MVHIEDVEEGWVFLKYERLPIFCYYCPIFCYCCGILTRQDHEYQKIRQGCLSSDDDDFQFGPWLCAMAPKFSQKKSNFSQSNPREEDDDEIHVSKDEKGEAESSQIYHQLIIPLLAGKSNEMAVRHQLDGPTRNYIEQEN